MRCNALKVHQTVSHLSDHSHGQAEEELLGHSERLPQSVPQHFP
jgi:hypothetical protein